MRDRPIKIVRYCIFINRRFIFIERRFILLERRFIFIERQFILLERRFILIWWRFILLGRRFILIWWLRKKIGFKTRNIRGLFNIPKRLFIFTVFMSIKILTAFLSVN